MTTKLSIIIPVYQVEAYVGETLASVFATSAPVNSFEVIVINDGTKDRSMEVVRRFADRPNLTVIEQENQGLSAARNRGMSAAGGEYVWFVDSDDYLVEDGVGKVLKLLEKWPEVDVLMFPVMKVYEDHSPSRLEYQVEKEQVLAGRTILRNNEYPLYFAHRYVFKRSIAEGNLWVRFPEGYVQEDDYWGPVLLYYASRVAILQTPVYNYRIRRPGSIMTNRAVRNSYDRVAVHKKCMNFMYTVIPKEDWPWFRRVCRYGLEMCYYMSHRFIGTQEFSRFAHRNGLYVWKEWLDATPDATWKKRLRRLCYYMTPAFYIKLTSLFVRLK